MLGFTDREMFYELEAFNKGQNKMTKEEAVKILKEKIPYGMDSVHPVLLVQSLEALGLIIFDQPKPKYNEDLINAVCNSHSTSAEEFLDNLKQYGYEVKKINKLFGMYQT